MSHSTSQPLTPPSEVATRDTSEAVLVRELYDVAGYRVAVGATPGDAEAAVRSILNGFGPMGAADGPNLPRYDLIATGIEWQVRVDDAVVHAGHDLLNALGTLESRLVNAALERRDDLFHLHGAALCLPTERTGIVIVGDSGRGKSTLAFGLMLRGFTPFSDDIALLDPTTLGLQPFRRAFHVDDDSWRLMEGLGLGPLAQRHAPVGYFAPPQWAERSVPVGWVLFPEYRPDAPPELVPLSPAETATAILSQSLTLSRATRVALTTTTRIVERARCYRFFVGDLVAAVGAVQQLVACPR